MADDFDKNRQSKVDLSSNEKGALVPFENVSRLIDSLDLPSLGDESARSGKVTFRPPPFSFSHHLAPPDQSIALESPAQSKAADIGDTASERPSSPSSDCNSSSNTSDKTEERKVVLASPSINSPIPYTTVSRPTGGVSSQHLETLRYRFMRPSETDWNNPFNGRGIQDFNLYGESSFGIPSTHTIPYNRLNNLHQTYPGGFPPPSHPGPSPHFRHVLPYHYPSAPTPMETPSGQDVVRLDNKYDQVESLRRELDLLRDEANRKRKELDVMQNGLETQSTRPAQSQVEKAKEDPEDSSQNLEIAELMKQLNEERAESKNLIESLKNASIQRDLDKEADYEQKLASKIAEEKERIEREAEAQLAAQRELVAKVEAERQAQEHLHQARLDAIQQLMEKLGDQVTMMQQKEDERHALEERRRKKKEAKKREHELKKQQRELEEQRQREEELKLEEQRQAEEQQRIQEEQAREEQQRIEEEMEMEEKRQEQERLQKLEQEALQRLREDWTRQRALEAEKRAEEEKLRKELEEKERAEQEAIERLRETIRAEERERIREEERMRQASAEEEKRKEEVKKVVDDETLRQVEEGVQRNLADRLRLEVQSLQDDLRRRAWAAQPEFAKAFAMNTPQQGGRRRQPQEQSQWDQNCRFPPSNPFSRRHRQGFRSQGQEQRYSGNHNQLERTRSQIFGDAYNQAQSTYDESEDAESEFGGSNQGQQPNWPNNGHTGRSTPAPRQASSQLGDDNPYEAGAAGIFAENPYSSTQQLGGSACQSPRPQSVAPSEAGQSEAPSNFDPTSVFMQTNGFNRMHGVNQYLSEEYVSELNRANARNFQAAFSRSTRPRTPRYDYRTVFDAGPETSPKEQQPNTTQAPGSRINSRVGSPAFQLNGVNGTIRGGVLQPSLGFDRQQPHTHRKPVQAPASVPTPPTESPMQPPGRDSPAFDSRNFHNYRGTFGGFPPAQFAQQDFPAQYVRLDQGATWGVLQNVPVLMLPVMPVYGMQMDQEATVPQGAPAKGDKE